MLCFFTQRLRSFLHQCLPSRLANNFSPLIVHEVLKRHDALGRSAFTLPPIQNPVAERETSGNEGAGGEGGREGKQGEDVPKMSTTGTAIGNVTKRVTRLIPT